MPNARPCWFARLILSAALCLIGGAIAHADEALRPCLPHSLSQSAAEQATSPPAAQASLIVASLNTAGEPRTADSLKAWVQSRALDVVLLQEAGGRSMDGEAFARALGDDLGFHVAYAPAFPVDEGESPTQGLAIVSRYPLGAVRVEPLRFNQLRFRSRCRIALTATVQTPDGPVGLVNVHLDTRISRNERVAQLKPLLDEIRDSAIPQIVGGDFNTQSVQWVRSTWPIPFTGGQHAAVHELMTSNGFETPFTDTPSTLSFFGLPQKLDWMYLRGLTALTWAVDEVRYSDHRGIWAQVRRDAAPVPAR